ncbi:NAD-dependent succinate-semialdehyde dehydrogenase [Blastococcus sp. PRF04-17]|nr:NAD-dependent succinate-semialdehyde dehydrogenase [Blastococcus sp. PRF04-17]UOY03344.1 NAD-dependent succinate-semialdehyde dehydrogenase [Blastococcus sp. PRF04-17]
MYAVTNPATGEVIETFPTATDDEVRDAIDRAHQGYLLWRERPPVERAAVVKRAAQLFAERADELAAIITTEMGKLLPEAKGEMGIVVDIWNYYADNAETLLADEPLTIQGGEAVIQKRPVGVLLGIMPWNYPYYQVARFAAPNLVLGNTILLKHAPSCPRSSAAIEALLCDAGLPEDAYLNLYATNEQVAEIIADPRVQGVSLTGSERAGAAVAAEAGRHLKKVVLELGGSDPMLVLDTADLDRTVKVAVESRMGNTGQACNAPKRMIVLCDLYDEFVDKLTRQMAEFTPGDPTDPATTLAPLSSDAAAERLVEQIESAVRQGATLRTGGHRVERPGAYVEPTVLTDVTPEMDVYRQELFGPVALVFQAEDEDDAVRLANDTPFGLGAGVFSEDRGRAARVGSRIDAGMVYVNQAGGSQADLPFGGIKRSGVGRELGPLGIEEFMNKKVIRL